MLKKIVRSGIHVMLVLFFVLGLVGISGAQPAKAAQPGIWVQIIYFPEYWNGSYDYTTWETWANGYGVVYSGLYAVDVTYGDIIQKFTSTLETPVTAYGYICEDYNLTIVDMFLPSDDEKVIDHPACDGYYSHVVILFNEKPSSEVTRLTLFGYIEEDGKSSCTLWSLDGSKNLRPDEKCGANVELVCTVKLVDSILKYECEDGYDWLGYNIAHDSKWVSWAEKFATINGR
jgi:hypothetical protein